MKVKAAKSCYHLEWLQTSPWNFLIKSKLFIFFLSRRHQYINKCSDLILKLQYTTCAICNKVVKKIAKDKLGL